MQYRILGPLEVLSDEGRPIPLGGPRERVLLATLLLDADRVVSADRLIEALWGDNLPVTAANTLQVHVSKVRKKLAGPVDSENPLRTEPPGYVLRVGVGELDSERFEHLATESNPDEEPLAVSARLAGALALWRGRVLDGLEIDVAGRADVARLEELRVATVEARIQADLALGRHVRLVAELEGLVHTYPVRERLRAQLMVALYRSGRQADALAIYRQTREVLAEELGIDPSQALQDLELAILNQSDELSAPVIGDTTRIEAKHPSGTVTLLFSDIEGSTSLWEEAPDAMASALRRHDELLRSAIESSEGYVFKTVGDAFCAAFQQAKDAVRAAEMAQRALFAEPWPDGLSMRIRMGLHTGTCDERGGDYFGPTVNRTARLDAVAHGGQTVLSGATADRVRNVLPDGIMLLDLGSHRLKDLGEPEHVYQLEIEGLDGQFPPLRSLDNPELGNNLPQQATSFVGRETQMAEVRSLFETTRLVTLVGAGGVGKSRLAIQLAAELLDGTGNGVWLVEFAPLSDPDFVPQALASVLSIRGEPGRAVVDTLLDVLRGRNLLLVLDNCEHLIGACAKVAHALLRSCPGVTLMATSREPLGIDGEQVFRVPSLSLPPTDGVQASEELGSSEAVQLFVARALAHDPTFVHEGANLEAVVSICRRLDGIPLALELAASRLGALSVAYIEARLDNRFRLLTTGSRTAFPRQQTLRALVDWSYDLLREPEQVVLSRSSVFAGSFTLESAETVCAGGVIDSAHVMDLLAALVDKSLIQADTSGSVVRYRLLETIRQYAGEKLAEHGEVETIRRTHALTFLRFAEEAALHLRDFTQADWLDRIGRDRDNLRVAAACLLADSDSAKEALRLVISLQCFWDIRGPMGEAIDTVEAALERSEDDGPTSLRAEAMAVAAEFKFDSGLVAQARIQAEDGLVMARQIGDPKLTVKLLCLVAFATFKQGNRTPDVFEYADEAVSLARKTGDSDLTGEALLTRHALIDESDPSRARADAAEALSKFRVTGNQRLIVVILNNLASSDMLDGDFATARSHLEEALVVARGIGDQRMFPSLLFNAGLVACLEGDHRTGKSSFTDALIRSESVGDQSMLALALLGLAMCATAEGDDMRAAAMHGAADVLIEINGEVLEPLEARAAEDDYHRLRDRIGLEAFEAAFDNGRQLTVQGAVAIAMKGSCGR